MAQTDEKVLELIKIAKAKKEEISKAEKPNWKTNCSFRYNPENPAAQNIQVVADVQILVNILAFLYEKENSFNKAAADLEVSDIKFTWGGSPVEDWKSDIRTRITKLQIKKKKDELEIVEKRLEKLISPEMRAQIELDELTQILSK